MEYLSFCGLGELFPSLESADECMCGVTSPMTVHVVFECNLMASMMSVVDLALLRTGQLGEPFDRDLGEFVTHNESLEHFETAVRRIFYGRMR